MMLHVCFTFLLLTSGTVAFLSVPVFNGHTVLLFPNSVSSSDKEVSIYYENESELLVYWTLKNATFVDTPMKNLSGKFFMDSCRNIWIRNVNSLDDGIYSIVCHGATKFKVKLTVLDKTLTNDMVEKWLNDHQEFAWKYFETKLKDVHTLLQNYHIEASKKDTDMSSPILVSLGAFMLIGMVIGMLVILYYLIIICKAALDWCTKRVRSYKRVPQSDKIA